MNTVGQRKNHILPEVFPVQPKLLNDEFEVDFVDERDLNIHRAELPLE